MFFLYSKAVKNVKNLSGINVLKTLCQKLVYQWKKTSRNSTIQYMMIEYCTQRVLNDLKRSKLSSRHMIWFLPHPPLLGASCLSFPVCRWPSLPTGEGGGWGRSQIIRRWEGLTLYKSYKSFNALWLHLWKYGGSSVERLGDPRFFAVVVIGSLSIIGLGSTPPPHITVS